MAESTLTDQQRHLMRTFRAIVTQRQGAEAQAAARFEAEQQAAGAAFDQANQAAEARLSAVHQAQGEAQALLARADLQSLGSQVRVQPLSAGPGDDPAQKLALHAARAKEVAAALPGLVEALQSARKNARRRQLILVAVSLIGLIAVVIFVAGALRDLQEQQALRQAQATATAEAIVAEATATAEAIVAEATATAEASVAQVTVTAEAAAIQATVTAAAPLLTHLEERYGIKTVFVPAGAFIMGIDDGYAYDRGPQHTIVLDNYWIGLTEVTNAQYRPFVEGGGYDDASLWTKAGWAWRQRNERIDQPGCWSTANLSRLDDCFFCSSGSARFDTPNQPVVCVSWYEAVAFTHWLARETGLSIRLPSDAEWEKAARGTDGRIYPWGDQEPTAELARIENIDGPTDPVGSYPVGASPYGALDMAGNAAEWISSLDWPFPYQADDGRETQEGDECCRVARSRSWFYKFNIRATTHSWHDPFDRDEHLGFRIVVAP